MNHKSLTPEASHFESLYPKDGWFDEIEKVLSFIKAGNSAQIISLPGVGRSNIMGLLSFNREARTLHLGDEEKTYHFVMMNFSEIRKRPLLDATKYMLLELIDSLEERKMDEEKEYVRNIFDQSLKSNDELVLFQGLRKTIDYLCLEKGLSVVFLFDRFEEYVPMLNPEFFSNLRVLRDRAKYKFSVVFPLNRPLEEMVENEIISDYYEFVVGNITYLPIKNDTILNFRLEYIQKQAGKKLGQEKLNSIISLTGGVGKLSRICAELCLSEKPPDNLSEFLLSNGRVKAVLGEMWKSFTPFEQNLIQEEKANESSHLVAIGIVKNNKLAIPLLENYALSQTESENQKITYNSEAKEIKKGNLVISDSLTSSEFKLLRFLLENPEKIIERDEIVTAVWGDLASTTGVSEQALDQLIFRVRKKIEENPNAPTHLQTVKGRGFKFNS